MNTEKLTKQELVHFTGTSQWYRHSILKNILYTDGIRYVAQKAGAYWLIDEIAYLQSDHRIKNEEFQVWTLCVDLEKSTAVLTCDDGNDIILHTKHIGYTDFPLEEIKVYFTDNVILLTSEY